MNSNEWETWVGAQAPAEFLANCKDGGTVEEFRAYVVAADADFQGDDRTYSPRQDWEIDRLAGGLHAYAHNEAEGHVPDETDAFCVEDIDARLAGEDR